MRPPATERSQMFESSGIIKIQKILYLEMILEWDRALST